MYHSQRSAPLPASPAGGRSPVAPSSARGRVGAGAARTQRYEATGFPHTPTRWEGLGGRSPHAGGWGNLVPQIPTRWEGLERVRSPKNTLRWRRGVGKPGFPTPPPAGGCGRAQPSRRGMEKPGFPIPSPGGQVWEGYALSRTILIFTPSCAAPPHTTADVNVARRNGAGQRNHAVPILYASGITERSTMFQGRSPAGRRPVALAPAPVQQR